MDTMFGLTPIEWFAIREIVNRYYGRFVRMAGGSPNYRVPAYYRAHAISVLFIDMTHEIGEKTTMAKVSKPQTNDFRGWVNMSLSDADKAAILDKAGEKSAFQGVWDWAAALIYQGWKFNLAWDAYSDSYQVSTFCWDAESPSHGYAFSSRHPEIKIAMVTQWYKLEQIAQGDLASLSDRPSVDQWG